ncbi:MAG: TIGR04211 family SH3 domain-containing protein [Proteobacteria bacterium]|nr:TIGR04211 family SH3 domain-containing protein [Pseudomonadota bacterium]
MRLPVRLLPALLMLACGVAAAADTAYVIDKLLVGIHESRDTDSAIIKVVPTGTKLEVLKRDGDVANVSEPGGASGWVDAAYLSAEPPAQVRIAELEKIKAALEDQLKHVEQASRGRAAGGRRAGQ